MKKRARYLSVVLTFTLFISVFSVRLYAQKGGVYYDHYTVNDGLPSQTIYKLIQDRNGFLWIATEAGVSCFDGKEFKNYTTEDGLGDNEVLDIYEDSKGRIWFIPFSVRISYYYNGKFYNEANDGFIKSLPRLSFYSAPVEDLYGNLYSNIRNDLQSILKIDADNKTTILSLKQLIGENDSLSCIYRSADKKTVYCLTKKNWLILFTNKTHSIINNFQIKTLPDLQNAHWQINSKKPESAVCIDTQGIHLITDTTSQLLIADKTLAHVNGKLNVTIDKYKNVWVTHPARNTMFYRYTDSGYAPPSHILSSLYSIIAFDNENNIWFCTSNQGLYKLPYAKLLDDATFNTNQKLLQKNVLCIYASMNGTLWMSYSNGCITQVTGDKVTHHNLNFNNRTYNRILQIIPDNDGDIWCIGDETCVMLKKLSGNTYSAPIRLKNKDNSYFTMPLKGIIATAEGNLIITTMAYQMLINKAKMTAEGVRFFSPFGERLYSSFFDSNGDKYVSTIRGLIYVKNDTLMNLSKTEPRLKTRIQHFAQNSTGTIFLATYSDGLLALENNRVVAGINRNQGLAGTICRRVFSRNDTLYVATNGGITIATYNNHRFTILQQMGQANGLPSVDVNDISFLNNVMHVATSEGIAAIALPVPKPRMVAPPQLTILSFTVNNTAYNTTSTIVFPYKQQRVNIEFIAPVMDKPATVQYRYRLGTTAQWNLTTTNQLEFNDLQYGEYAIELQAKKYNSEWGQSKKLHFTITPPYYSTWWFRVLIVLAAAFGIFSLVRYILTKRFKQQFAELKQKEAIEKERNRIAADIHDDIGAELTNIVILSRILKGEKTAEKPYENIVDKLEKSSNEVITKMNEVIWTLNASNDTLHNLAAYLRTYITTFLTEHGLQDNVTIDDTVYTDLQLKAETNRSIFLTVKEILHNVVKHACATAVSVDISFHNAILFIKISDNGTGFDVLQLSAGNGLQNIKKRVGAMAGEIEIASSPAEGTTITIKIPLA